ncbi:MAG: MAPEG family protein [Crinalium sp.]
MKSIKEQPTAFSSFTERNCPTLAGAIVVPWIRHWMSVRNSWMYTSERNHHDNLAAIATVILIAQVTGQTDRVTAIASIILLCLRLLHSLTYIFGIIIIRSLVYFGAVAALLTIVWRIFN